jgi:pimeloyl-ACP methyl ester carboxylesterase
VGNIVLGGDDATETATVNGVKLEYEAQGGGEPMLLIHGASVVEAARDADTLFGTEFTELEKGLFSAADAPRVQPPALSLVGGRSDPPCRESHAMFLKWLPRVEGMEIPRAAHFLQVEEPRALAEAIARFVVNQPPR